VAILLAVPLAMLLKPSGALRLRSSGPA
jgi:hypothetical protein